MTRFALGLWVALFATAVSAQDLAGSWRGTLDTPSGSLTLILHITPEADGYSATADSPDQGVTGLAGTVEASGADVVVGIAAVGARYEASVDGDTMSGTFSQGGGMLPLTLTRLAKVSTRVSDRLAPLVGDWQGTIAGTLRLILHLTPGASADTLTATLDSPDQESYGIPTAGAWLDASGGLVVSIPAVSGGYEAEIRGDSLIGTWTQGSAIPLVLTRASGESGMAAPRVRPQTPVGPFPYREEELNVVSTPEVTLAGTLTLPEGEGPFTAVVLVSGSGPQDRDETILDHKAFAVWADRLARAGVATYRFDDRGTASSTGDWASATVADFSADAAAAVQALLARDDIRSAGVMGHSEGGYVAPSVARLVPETAFVVLLAGPGVAGSDVYVEQNKLIAESQGTPEAIARLYSEVVEALIGPFSIAGDTTPLAERRALGDAAARARLADAPEAQRMALLQGQDPSGTIDALLDFVGTPGIGSFLAYDPQPDLRALRIPSLAVFGALDLQVPAAQSVGPMREALNASSSTNHAIVTFDKINHLLQPATTGSVAEYGQIETTIDEEVLGFVTRWIAGLQ